MKNKTEISGISIADRGRQAVKNCSSLLELLVFGALGFFMANARLFGEIAPFGPAFCAAAGSAAPAAALGAALGYIFSYSGSGSMVYIAAVLLVLGFRWLMGAFGEDKALWLPAQAGLAVAIPAAGAAISGGLTVYEGILALSQGILAAGGSYFFSRTERAVRRKESFAQLARPDFCCVLLSFGILTLSAAGIQVGPLSLGRVLAVLAVLFCARYGERGELAGAAAGVAAGAAMGLLGQEYLFLTGVYGIGGLLAGMFGNLGKLGCAAAFAAVYGAGLFLTVRTPQLYNTVYEVFAAALVFLAVPAKAGRRLFFLTKKQVFQQEDSLKNVLTSRMDFTGKALQEIAEVTQQVSEKLEQRQEEDVSSIYARAIQKVCGRCGMNGFCWQNSYNSTMNGMIGLHKLMEQKGCVTKETVPRQLAANCGRLDQLLEETARDFQGYSTRRGAEQMVSQVRAVVSDQFEGMAQLLWDFSRELGELSRQSLQLEEKVREKISARGLEPRGVCCFEDQDGRMTIETSLPAFQINRVKALDLAFDLGELCGKDFDRPAILQSQGECRLRFVEASLFVVESGICQLSKEEGRICGDACQQLTGQKMQTILLLSDGMGAGPRAAVDSNIAIGLLSRLLAAGVGFSAALKMVNSALLVKSGEESLATVDITAINLYTGRTDFLKAGAAPTFVRKNGRAGSVEAISLPAGILRGVEFESTNIQLGDGDWVVMVSDGVTMDGFDWIQTFLEQFEGTPAQLAEGLAKAARSKMEAGHEDDITVIAARIVKK